MKAFFFWANTSEHFSQKKTCISNFKQYIQVFYNFNTFKSLKKRNVLIHFVKTQKCSYEQTRPKKISEKQKPAESKNKNQEFHLTVEKSFENLKTNFRTHSAVIFLHKCNPKPILVVEKKTTMSEEEKEEKQVSENADENEKDERDLIPQFISWANESWINHLNPDPEEAIHRPNKISREVLSGHYVLVDPTPLPDPLLMAYTSEVGEMIGLNDKSMQSEAFIKYFSGDSTAISGFNTWSTPYALSIYGQKRTDNCPFGTGNGYGDGRAISVAEVLNPITNGRWEMQLKGSGTTPFCRGGDGRAVLR